MERFLALVDGELDNQPVTLIEALPMSKIDELNSSKDWVLALEKLILYSERIRNYDEKGFEVLCIIDI